ncbi:MAG: cytochrome c oxidase subunit II [Acidobacteria bacterium]|nr:MAG: cytochrome c oxidase subunit II [Acidobacteriota bacterium]
MGLAIAVVVALITLISTGIFLSHHWWLPHAISTIAPAIDRQFTLTFVSTGIIFVIAQLALAYAVWRFRDGGDTRRAAYSHGNTRWEVVWTTAAAILFIGLNLIGYQIWASVHFTGPEPGAMQVEVWGEQFNWYFRYPGPDNRFGPTHPEKMNDGIGNFLGLDRSHDADSKDDIVTATLAVPVNREVELVLRSKDVTHSFFVRELRLKQDLVPGLEIPIHFMATETGRYEIVCSQLCGLGHYKMRAYFEVMSQPDFDKWLETQAAAQ